MPLYEYLCADCGLRFEKLRPMSKVDEPIACVQCGSAKTSRAISLFSAISKSKDGGSRTVSGTGAGCASCSRTSCATCDH
jgi:putative FmdB family regulatory protein